MIMTLKRSIVELGMLILYLIFSLIVFSSAIYYAEKDVNTKSFSNIPDTFWFTMVTMTTVGYGDEVSVTPLGQLIVSLCALSGVLVIALMVNLMGHNFQKCYKNSKKEEVFKERRNIDKNIHNTTLV